MSAAFERKLNDKILELSAGWDPSANVWPLRQLILEVWAMELDLVKIRPITGHAEPPKDPA